MEHERGFTLKIIIQGDFMIDAHVRITFENDSIVAESIKTQTKDIV